MAAPVKPNALPWLLATAMLPVCVKAGVEQVSVNGMAPLKAGASAGAFTCLVTVMVPVPSCDCRYQSFPTFTRL